MSGIVFRLYENLVLGENDPNRFRLEIMVNRGAIAEGDYESTIEEHTIPISYQKYIDINRQLTLNDVDDFFKNLLQYRNFDHSGEFSDSLNSESHTVNLANLASPYKSLSE
jgi:hypothetical protein